MTILQDRDKQVFSSGILRLVGYGLLLIVLVDLLFLLIPTQLNNPLWEFQTMGAMVERVPVTLLGIVLIYYGEKSDRAFFEATILKLLSWFSLSIAVALMLTIPISISDSLQIYNYQSDTANAQFAIQQDTIEQFEQKLKAANSKEEIGIILQQQARQQINIPDSINIEKLKTDIVANLQNDRDSAIAQANVFRVQKKSLLFKKCFKWNLGALIASILFFMIWKSTGWARLKAVANNS